MQGGYPARLKKVLIVTAPLWFKAPFKILRLFVREKLRERVFTVSVPQLSLHVPRKALPVHLGGTLEIDHATWLQSCRASMTNREDELLANIVAGPAATLSNGGSNDTTSSSAVSSAASSSNNSSSNSNGATAAAAAATIISAVHQLADSNTTVVTVGTAAAAAAGGLESTIQSTSTQQQSTEPNENITINGLSPSHRLKLNTSGIQQQQQPLNGDSTTASTAAATATAAGSVAAVNGSAAAGAGAGGTGAGAAAAVGAAAGGGAAGEFWTENPPSSASSGFSDDDSLAGQEGDPKTIEQIVQMVRERCRQGLIKEYADIRNRAPEGTFLHAR